MPHAGQEETSPDATAAPGDAPGSRLLSRHWHGGQGAAGVAGHDHPGLQDVDIVLGGAHATSKSGHGLLQGRTKAQIPENAPETSRLESSLERPRTSVIIKGFCQKW